LRGLQQIKVGEAPVDDEHDRQGDQPEKADAPRSEEYRSRKTITVGTRQRTAKSLGLDVGA
jgi:hypothetical protein